MERGYIKLWRKTMESRHFSMSLKHIGMFDYLLLKANWKPGYFRGHKIEPGQMATSITHLAETVGEQRHRVKRLLNDLESCGMIMRQNVSNRWVLITVCNWALYQSSEDAKSPTGVQPESNRVPRSKKVISNTPFNEVVKEWNNRCKNSGLWKVKKVTEERKKKIAKALKAYTVQELLMTFDNFHGDKWRKENPKNSTFDIALRAENLTTFYEMQEYKQAEERPFYE